MTGVFETQTLQVCPTERNKKMKEIETYKKMLNDSEVHF